MAAARRLARRVHRGEDAAFLVEGPQGVREALEHPGGLLDLFVTDDAVGRHADLLTQAADLAVPVQRVTAAVMAGLTDTVTPQGLLGIARTLDVPLADAVAGRPRLVAVLVDVRDPGNAGSVLRVADAAGADAVVVAGDSVDVYNGKCVRSSAGSLFHLPLVVGVAPAQAVESLRGAGARVLAADGRAAVDLDDEAAAGRLAAPTAWLFGNEAHGLPPTVLALADVAVRVPIHGRAESLNLATAAAVCLYASARAQRVPSRGRPATGDDG